MSSAVVTTISTTTTASLDFVQTLKHHQPANVENNVNNTHFVVTTPNTTNTAATDSSASNNNNNIKVDNSTTSETTVIPTQIAQWVYIQTPPKITMSTPTIVNKNSAASNIVVNSMAPLQISSLATNINNKNLSLQPNQSVILAAHPVNSNSVKPQHVFIQKQAGSVQTLPVLPVSVPANVAAAKNTLTYLTMFKSAPHLVGGGGNPLPPNQKYVIAPMPKLTTNRLPATVTTNCVQSKIAFMPVSLQNTICKPAASKHKVYNLKIADGQLQSESNGAITVMCDNNMPEELEQNNQNRRLSSGEEQSKLVCSEVIEIDSSPQKKETSVEEKSYELSIVEDSNSKNEVNYTITIPDDTDKAKVHPFNNNRDQHKFPKHGVSILKKNFNLDIKTEKTCSSGSLIISPIPNSITTISDSHTKEVKITTSSSFNNSVIITEPKVVVPQKSERRRKSNFSYRKDYDEVIVTSNSNNWEKKKTMDDDPVVTVTKMHNAPVVTPMEDVMEVEAIPDKADINMNEDFDAKKILAWEDGIGTLPGSEIKFHINEFGFLEYLKKDEHKQILNKKFKPRQGNNNNNNSNSSNRKEDFQEEMRCLECGCYGMPSEFISPKYCSYDCQEAGNKAAKQRESKLKRKTKAWIKRTSELSIVCETKQPEKDDLPSEEDQSTSNENSQDKFSNYPWTCTKKGFSWAKYLEHVKAKAAPVKFFKDPFPYNRNGFRPGMKLEGVDPQHPSYFCILTVAEVIGYRLRLHFDGFSENYDFWVNADSMDIFPAGWCEKYGHVLHPPRGYTTGEFNWTAYLKHTKSTVAPKHLFANRAGSAICPNGFRVGMKLEAVDRKNTSLVCVATVSDMMDNRILVHFDSWDDIYDYWADPTSPYIHPVSWCDQNGHNLTPPNDYPNPETFTWERYLKETRSVAAPVRAFKQRPVYGFKKGMRLECVDKRVQQLIRAATVDDVREHQIRIKFDGWPDRYSYWIDNDSPNIHPVGWCQKTGHPIEPPLTPDDVYDFLECPTVGCRGQGHTKGPQFPSHSSPKDCPYADENMDRENTLPDRLLSPDRQLEAVVPVSREPRDKPKSKLGRPPKIPKREPSIKLEWNDDDDLDTEDCKPLKRKSPKSSKSLTENSSISERSCKKEVLPLTNGYSNTLTEQIWEKHSKYLTEEVKISTDPRDWQEDEVVKFVTALPYCRNYGALFKEHQIDGEAFLMLSQQDLVDILNIKLGPAIKLYSIIMLLRRNVI